jgi:hypothetical protein
MDLQVRVRVTRGGSTGEAQVGSSIPIAADHFAVGCGGLGSAVFAMLKGIALTLCRLRRRRARTKAAAANAEADGSTVGAAMLAVAEFNGRTCEPRHCGLLTQQQSTIV